ncbi:hypothetical protein AB0M61_01660 [Streptomyces sp. NPDC051642]|uniref:hypothetical protein n=1 Tax=Streptomyces sp. NPDC051642 TaxID=3154646 RepID=UPI003442B39C
MPYEYWCGACDAVSPEQRQREVDAEQELVEHRRAAHGALRPAAGDGVRHVHSEARGDGLLPAGWFWALLFLLGLFLANCSGLLAR